MKEGKEKEGRDKILADAEHEKKKSFCTHIFIRSQLSIPAISLVGLEEPSTAVRCSPILYKMVTSSPFPTKSSSSSSSTSISTSTSAVGNATNDENVKVSATATADTTTTTPVADKKEEEEAKDEVKVEEKSMIPGSYRIMFAVVTISSVLVYDTQHEVRSFCFYYHVLCFIGYVFMNL